MCRQGSHLFVTKDDRQITLDRLLEHPLLITDDHGYDGRSRSFILASFAVRQQTQSTCTSPERVRPSEPLLTVGLF